MWAMVLLMTLALVGAAVLARLITRPSEPSPVVPDPRDQEYDEHREQLLDAAFLAGHIPPVWYRQQKAAIAAETDSEPPRP